MCNYHLALALSVHNKQKNSPSGAKKAHDWAVDQLADLFCTTHRAKTQQVIRNRGQHCGDIELALVLMETYVTLMTKIGH